MTKAELRNERIKRTISDPVIFAKRLDAVMKENGVAKTSLEQDGIISLEQLYSYLRAESMPSARVLQGLCSYIGVSADFLLGLSNVKEPMKDWTFANGMWCCPYCKGAGEPHNKFCPNCGRRIDID